MIHTCWGYKYIGNFIYKNFGCLAMAFAKFPVNSSLIPLSILVHNHGYLITEASNQNTFVYMPYSLTATYYLLVNFKVLCFVNRPFSNTFSLIYFSNYFFPLIDVYFLSVGSDGIHVWVWFRGMYKEQLHDIHFHVNERFSRKRWRKYQKENEDMVVL